MTRQGHLTASEALWQGRPGRGRSGFDPWRSQHIPSCHSEGLSPGYCGDMGATALWQSVDSVERHAAHVAQMAEQKAG